MTGLGLPIFDKTIQDANIWVNDVMFELDWGDKHRACTLLRSPLHTLRDRLQVNENAQFAAQLPTLVRGIYYEGYQPSQYSAEIRHKDQLVDGVMAAFSDVHRQPILVQSVPSIVILTKPETPKSSH